MSAIDRYFTGAELKALCKNKKLKDVVIRCDGINLSIEVSNNDEAARISRPMMDSKKPVFCFIDMYGNSSNTGAWTFFIDSLKPSDLISFYSVRNSTADWEKKYSQRWDILFASVERKTARGRKAWHVPVINEFKNTQF